MMQDRNIDPDVFTSFFEDQAKVYKKSVRRVIAVILVICIFFGLLGFMIGRASAQDFTYVSGMSNFDASLINDSLWPTLYNYIVNQSDFNDYHEAIVCYDPHYWQNGVRFCAVALCSDPIINCGGVGQIVTEYPDSDCVFFVIDSFNQEPFRHSYSYSKVNDSYVYTVTSFYNYSQPAFSYGYTWCSSNLRGYGSNLVFRDNRLLTATPYYYYQSSYLRVYTDADIPDHNSFIVVGYTDQVGSYTYSFQPYEYLNMSKLGGFTQFDLNIFPIPASGNYTITSLTLTVASSWGEKTIPLSLQFGSEDMSNLPSSYTDISYFQNFYNSQNNSSIGATFKSNLYFGVYNNGQGFYLRDGANYLVQNFDVRFIALPDFLWNPNGIDLANWDLEDYYEIFEMYDFVILGLGQSAFDELYGAGLYMNLHDNFVSVSSVVNQIEKWEPEYISTDKILFESHPQDFDWSFYWSDIGFIVTRNYLLKKTFYSIGDVDSRILDFETKLFSENGPLSTLQSKLVTGLTQDFEFFNKAIDFFQGVTAFQNDLLLSDWFNKVTDYLKSIVDSLYLDFSESSFVHPWIDIYDLGKKIFEDGQDYLDEFSDSAGALIDGITIPENYPTDVALPIISGTPVPIPTLPSVTPIPIEVGD